MRKEALSFRRNPSYSRNDADDEEVEARGDDVEAEEEGIGSLDDPGTARSNMVELSSVFGRGEDRALGEVILGEEREEPSSVEVCR